MTTHREWSKKDFIKKINSIIFRLNICIICTFLLFPGDIDYFYNGKEFYFSLHYSFG